MNYYLRLKVLLVILAIFLPTMVLGQTSALFRDLVVGSTGEDVRILQQWLNSHGYQISSFGAGAPGAETTYFGKLTQAALARYQATFGIVPATGNLDLATRLKISGPGSASIASNLPAGCTSTVGFSPLTGKKCDQSEVKTVVSPILTSSTNQAADLGGFALPPEIPLSKTMAVSAISPSSGPAGTTVVITGYGFDRYKNQVHIGFSVTEVGSSDGKTLKFSLDPMEDVELATQSNISSVLSQYDVNASGNDDGQADLLTVADPSSANNISVYVVNKSGRSSELIFKLNQ